MNQELAEKDRVFSELELKLEMLTQYYQLELEEKEKELTNQTNQETTLKKSLNRKFTGSRTKLGKVKTDLANSRTELSDL